MPWKEVSTGTYERLLDNSEQLLKHVALAFKDFDREHWAVNVVFQIDVYALDSKSRIAGDSVILALRRAWTQIRYQHPSIAAVLEGDTLRYRVPNAAQLESWLNESFVVHQNEAVDDFCSSAGWVTYSTLHYFTSTSEVLMRTHHWLLDGIGSLHFANRFLQILAKDETPPAFGTEWKSLQPSHLEAAKLPAAKDCSPEVEGKAQAMFFDYVGKFPSIGLPCSMWESGPGLTRRSKIRLEKAILESLLTACKKSSLGLASAVHAALSLATMENAESTVPAKYYASIASINYRPYMPQPYDDVERWPMGVWMLGLPTALTPAQDFQTRAKTVQQVYKQPMHSTDASFWDVYDSWCGKVAALLANPPPGMPPPTTPALSSIGLIDGCVQGEYRGSLRVVVKNIELFVDIIGPTILIYQWSWQGNFYMSACYNEGCYSAAFVDEFLERVWNILHESLGL